ncbi:MAG TPA: peptidoglycan DD-metalloendopeptidase family protein [Actinomycetota bacterium]|nr:peptidoglycan DD-metalloendopeptidase family protein [Actinomycetota bacterium]
MSSIRSLRVWSVVLLAAFLFLFSFGAPPAVAQSKKEIDKRKEVLREKIKAAENQAKTLSGQIAESDRRKAALDKEISGLTAAIRQAENRLAASEADLGVARNELLATEASLSQTGGRLETLNKRLAERTRSHYKSGPAHNLGILLSAEDIRGFITRLNFLRSVVQEDRGRVQALEKLSSQLSVSRDLIIQRKVDITAQMEAVEAEKSNIAKMRESLRVSKTSVVEELATRQKLLSQVQSDKASYLKEMAQLERESRSISSLLKSRQKGQVFQAGSGGKLAWPTTGRVTSSYGYRTHPIFKDRRLHAGIDIGAPAGQSVIAAEAGTVVFAAVRSGYGLTVVIDHGNALGTMYAHLSGVNVSTGSKVARGTRVGSVGCSGYCTGPHLHFEARVNGEPRDPMGFF